MHAAIASICPDTLEEVVQMVKHKRRLPTLNDLRDAASSLVFKASTLAQMGKDSEALPLWITAAESEERLAPLLDAGGREEEAAIHRISAGSCYRRAGEWGRAVNAFRAALAGPLPRRAQKDVEGFLSDCLAHLAPARRNGRASAK